MGGIWPFSEQVFSSTEFSSSHGSGILEQLAIDFTLGVHDSHVRLLWDRSTHRRLQHCRLYVGHGLWSPRDYKLLGPFERHGELHVQRRGNGSFTFVFGSVRDKRGQFLATGRVRDTSTGKRILSQLPHHKHHGYAPLVGSRVVRHDVCHVGTRRVGRRRQGPRLRFSQFRGDERRDHVHHRRPARERPRRDAL